MLIFLYNLKFKLLDFSKNENCIFFLWMEGVCWKLKEFFSILLVLDRMTTALHGSIIRSELPYRGVQQSFIFHETRGVRRDPLTSGWIGTSKADLVSGNWYGPNVSFYLFFFSKIFFYSRNFIIGERYIENFIRIICGKTSSTKADG
jgi:hypothetical protein